MKALLPTSLIGAALLASLPLAHALEPRVAFEFNNGNGTSTYGAKANPVELKLVGPDGQPASVFTPSGGGLTGKPGDFALDFTKSTQAMGVAGQKGALAKVSPGDALLGSMTSFTITGWMKIAAKLDGAARLIEYTDPVQGGFNFFAGGSGMLSLTLNKKTASTPYRGANAFNTGAENKWVFFAVTYDGSKTAQNVVFYGGTPDTPPAVVSTGDLDGGKTTALNSHGALIIGNNGGGIRPFYGVLDDLAIYTSAQDGSGALSAEQILEIYKANLSATPSASATERPLKIALIGDSIVCEYPETSLLRGWGQMLREFTTPGVIYDNQAQGGKSTKSFPPERWQKILAEKPDFVLIQFGANDAHGPGAPESTDAATDFRDNLRRYITEARAASITPVLVTAPHRRLFQAGTLTRELAPYAEAMKAVGAELKVPVIDLYEESGRWIGSLGEEKSTPITVNRGPNPANDDRSHYTKEGATMLAKFVSQGFVKVDPRLAGVLKTK